ncbi:MAG: hypothetical protein GWN58_27910 [Anaerolineae bacterium]|nr:hypothetical protein [Anaerolineae bacterium]
MSDNKALATQKEAELIHRLYELEYGLSLPIEELAKRQLVLIMAAAEQQIDLETQPDSPWTLHTSDSRQVRNYKAKMRQFEIAKRALAISERRRAASELIQVKIAAEIQKRKLHNYPADGTWKDMTEIVREILPNSRSGSLVSALGLLNRAEEFDALDIDGADVVAKIAAEKKWMLGQIQLALNRVIDDDTPDDEKKATVAAIIEDAAQLSIRNFAAKHLPSRTPGIPTSTWKLPDGNKMYIMRANEEQDTLLRGRMRGLLDYQANDMFRPITPGAIYSLLRIAIEEGSDLVPYIVELLEKAVLATAREYSVYSLLNNQIDKEKGTHLWCDLDTLKPHLPAYSPPTIVEALEMLAYYGLVEEMEIKGSMKLWRVASYKEAT